MIPAEKYMNIDGNKGNNHSRATDMKFAPFKGNNPSSNPRNTVVGWIPVYLYPNMAGGMPYNMNTMNMGSMMGNMGAAPMTNMSSMQDMAGMPNMQGMIGMPNMQGMTGMPNMQGMTGMSNMPNSNTTNSSMQNNNFNPNEFPDETSENMLYSYNNPDNNQTNPNSTNNTVSSTNSTQKREVLQSTYEASENYNKMLEILKEFNVDLDEDTDLSRTLNDDIDKIYKEFESENPGTFSLLKTYNVPYPIVKMIIKRIIKISLKNCNKEGE